MTSTERAPTADAGPRGEIETDGDRMRFVDTGQAVDAVEAGDQWRTLAKVEWEPVGEGARMFLTMTEHTPVGPPTAPLVARMLRFVDQQWNVGIPPLVAAAP